MHAPGVVLVLLEVIRAVLRGDGIALLLRGVELCDLRVKLRDLLRRDLRVAHRLLDVSGEQFDLLAAVGDGGRLGLVLSNTFDSTRSL